MCLARQSAPVEVAVVTFAVPPSAASYEPWPWCSSRRPEAEIPVLWPSQISFIFGFLWRLSASLANWTNIACHPTKMRNWVESNSKLFTKFHIYSHPFDKMLVFIVLAIGSLESIRMQRLSDNLLIWDNSAHQHLIREMGIYVIWCGQFSSPASYQRDENMCETL